MNKITMLLHALDVQKKTVLIRCYEILLFSSYRLVLHTSLCFISPHVNSCSTVVRPCMADYGCLVARVWYSPAALLGSAVLHRPRVAWRAFQQVAGLLPSCHNTPSPILPHLSSLLSSLTYPTSLCTPPLSLLPQVCYTAICTLGWLPALHTPSQVLLLLRLSFLPDLPG